MNRKSALVKLALVLPLAMLAVGCGGDDDDPLRLPSSKGYLRVGHFSPDAPAVDVRANGSVVLANVPFGALSGYLDLSPGTYRIQVSPAGQTTPVVIDANVNVSSMAAQTVGATGYLGNGTLGPTVWADNFSTTSGKARVRFVHASPDAPAVDVVVAGGPTLFTNVAFKEAEGYIEVNPGTYNLQVRVAGTTTVALNVPNVSLAGGITYSIFAIGEAARGTLAALPAVDAP